MSKLFSTAVALALVLWAAGAASQTAREVWEALDRSGAQAGANREEALMLQRQALAIAEGEALAKSAAPAWQAMLMVSALRVGRLLAELDRNQEATTIFGQAIAMAGRLAGERPDQAAVLWRPVGAALEELRRSPKAVQVFEQALAGSDAAKRSLLIVYGNVGGALWDQREFVGAVEAYKAAQSIAKRRAASGDASAAQDLALTDDAVGTAYMALNYSAAALEYLQEAVVLRQRLADATPDAPRLYDLSWSHERLGQALLRRRKLPESLKEFEAALDLRRRGAVIDASNPLWETDMANGYGQLGNVLVLLNRKEDAKKALEEGRALAVRHHLDTSLFDNALAKLE